MCVLHSMVDIRLNIFVKPHLIQAEAFEYLAVLQASDSVIAWFHVFTKPLTKVTNNLPVPFIKIEMESIDDSSAQQLTPSSVTIPTYACEIIKKYSIKYGSRLNLVSG